MDDELEFIHESNAPLESTSNSCSKFYNMEETLSVFITLWFPKVNEMKLSLKNTCSAQLSLQCYLVNGKAPCHGIEASVTCMPDCMVGRGEIQQTASKRPLNWHFNGRALE